MVRKFVTLDGYVIAEDEWRLSPLDRCFYCGNYLILVRDKPCTHGQGGFHDFVTLCSSEIYH